ncbi:MAG: hypothetical protein FOGNACKC_02374 [Anaerolineae bacterium]|nr:hypothetical protein [Anaerolineae bacterium]
MTRARLAWLLPAAFIVWLFFVLASFFAVQKPFAPATAAALAGLLLDGLTAGWLLLLALGLGLWGLRWLRLASLSPGERLIFGVGLGLGALGMVSLGVGLTGWFNRPAAYAITLILTLVALPQLRRLWVDLRRWRPANRPSRLAAVYLSAYAALALLPALLPPTDWDGLFYHLTSPKLAIEAGRIVGGVDVPHFNFPALMEMLFAWAMLLRGDVAAKLLHAGYGFLLTGVVYLAASRLLDRRAGWPAVILLASMPMLATLAGWAYNDLALAFYQLAAIYAITNYELRITNENPEKGNSPLIIGGVFAGLAMSLKYTSFVTPLFGVALITYYALRNTQHATRDATRYPPFAARNSPLVIRSVAIFALPALLVATPWYLKNWALTGNPVYPFLFNVFGGAQWDSFRASWYAAAGTGVGWQPGTLAALPWLLTLGTRDANYWDGRTGPLLLLFLPLVIGAGLSRRFAGRPVPAAAKILLVFALAHYLVWTLGVVWSQSLWQSRLLLPGLAALAPVSGWVWASLPGFNLPRFSLSRFVNIAVALTLALTLADVALLTLKIDPLPALAGFESRADYLTRRLGAHYAAIEQINQLPPAAKIVFLWEPRSYYCQRDCRPDSILDEFAHLVYRHGSAAAIARQWQAEGVTHVLIHRAGLEFMRQHQPAAVDEPVLAQLLANHLQLVADVAGAYQLYQLK